MNVGWTEVALGDVITEARSGFACGADVDDGLLQVRMNNVTVDGGLNFAQQRRVPNDVDRSAFLLQSHDVLFNATNSPELVGKTALFRGRDEPVVFSNHFLRLRTDRTRLIPSYLTRWLQYQYSRGVFRGMSQQWVNQATVRKERLLASVLPLPPLEEQQRIAKILDTADVLRERCASSIEVIAELRGSVFLETALHTDGLWPIVQVADLADQARGGIRTGPFGSQLLHSEFVDAGVAVLGIDNAVANEFRWGVERHITEMKYSELRRYTVHPGDVLITIMGTCGRVAVVPADIGRAINTKHLCCITLDRSRCLPEFLHAYFLRHPMARHHLASRAKGAIMAGLNMTIIKELPVSLPPIGVQIELVDRLVAVDRAHARAALERDRVDSLFESLQQRAFSGAL
jgi:type I restriction enzyme S subunit